MTNNQISYWNYQELVRSNRAKEAETQRANVAKEEETARANRAQESIAYDRYLEEVRANKQRESISWASLAEQKRAALVAESQRSAQVLLWNAETGLTQQKSYTEMANTQKTWGQAELTQKDIDWYDSKATASVARDWANVVQAGVTGVANAVKTATLFFAP